MSQKDSMAFADEEEPGQILSQDARGRVLVSRERRESLLEEYDRSGVMAPLNQCFLVKNTPSSRLQVP
jgi:hypothetical protein